MMIVSQVLIKYLHYLGRDDEIELASATPGLSVDGDIVIPDLVLSRTLKCRAKASRLHPEVI